MLFVSARICINVRRLSDCYHIALVVEMTLVSVLVTVLFRAKNNALLRRSTYNYAIYGMYEDVIEGDQTSQNTSVGGGHEADLTNVYCNPMPQTPIKEIECVASICGSFYYRTTPPSVPKPLFGARLSEQTPVVTVHHPEDTITTPNKSEYRTPPCEPPTLVCDGMGMRVIC